MKGQLNERIFFMDRNEEQPLYIRLYDAIVESIEKGDVIRHEKMPSVRQLSKSMNISRTTIENSYSQLVAEGYIYSKPQKGYYVSDIKETEPSEEEHLKHQIVFEKENKSDQYYDFVSEYVEYANFDMRMWKRNINKVITQNEIELFSGSETFGEKALRESICNYFGRVRGIKAVPEQVIIDAGTQNLLASLSHFFYSQGIRQLYIENPGFVLAREAFERSGFMVQGIPLKEKVIDVTNIKIKSKSVVFVSPSYQFPYGEIMPISHRKQLLTMVQKKDSYIVEDDYNNELRYVGKPINSLQGMDVHDRVIYLGSFSTLLIPSIRISFMVLPKPLVNSYKSFVSNKVQGASKLEQLALSYMLNSQDFSKHIRKLRKNYRIKNDLITRLYIMYLKDDVLFESTGAGVSCILTLKRPVDKKKLSAILKKKQLKIGLLSDYFINKEEIILEKNLVLNYRGISHQNLNTGMLLLKEVLCQIY